MFILSFSCSFSVEATVEGYLYESPGLGWFCRGCDYQTQYRSQVVRHIEGIHVKLPRYACTLCDKKFTVKYARRMHYIQVHGMKLSSKNIDALAGDTCL